VHFCALSADKGIPAVRRGSRIEEETLIERAGGRLSVAAWVAKAVGRTEQVARKGGEAGVARN
jgi:hypothetical protein